mmetsp:Transcript_34855/g.75246  ORF Transcript_34855/g.75246 Transcript_34855/m.75246 type:complete len:221 (+) Transcript_34855:570-1232(+)
MRIIGEHSVLASFYLLLRVCWKLVLKDLAFVQIYDEQLDTPTSFNTPPAILQDFQLSERGSRPSSTPVGLKVAKNRLEICIMENLVMHLKLPCNVGSQSKLVHKIPGCCTLKVRRNQSLGATKVRLQADWHVCVDKHHHLGNLSLENWQQTRVVHVSSVSDLVLCSSLWGRNSSGGDWPHCRDRNQCLHGLATKFVQGLGDHRSEGRAADSNGLGQTEGL